MRAPRYIAPNRLGVVLRITRGDPHRDHAAVPVSLGTVEPPPGMAADRNHPPPKRFRMGNGSFDLLVLVARPCHSIEFPIFCLLTFVDIFVRGQQPWSHRNAISSEMRPYCFRTVAETSRRSIVAAIPKSALARLANPSLSYARHNQCLPRRRSFRFTPRKWHTRFRNHGRSWSKGVHSHHPKAATPRNRAAR
jgi:hypothetical protein